MQPLKIIITGSNGFLGQHLMRLLREVGYDPYPVVRSDYDLRHELWVKHLFKYAGTPDVIFHLAAHVGGIRYNLAHAGELFYDNASMATNLIHEAHINGVSKFIMTGTVCSYPAFPPVPTDESALWTGYPEPSNGAYGLAKLAALEMLQAYHQQYEFNFSYPVLSNLYGPGDRGFFESERAHMLPNMIKQFVNDETGEITLFGDGNLTRDFLYIEDAARALVKLLDVDYHEPFNVSPGLEISKRTLADLLVELTDYQGRVLWDGKPDAGQLRRCYDNTRLWDLLKWKPSTSLHDGLQKTIEWYRSSKA